MKVKILVSPFIIIPIFTLSQFFIWFFLFPLTKELLPNLSNVKFYITSTSLLKYFALYLTYYISIYFGYNLYLIKNDNSIVQTISKIYQLPMVFINIADLLFAFIIFIEIYFNKEILSYIRNSGKLLQIGGMANLASITQQNEDNWFKTIYNFLPLILAIYLIKYFSLDSKKIKFFIKFRMALIVIISILLFFRASRQIVFVLLMILFINFIKYRIGFNKRINISRIIIFILLFIIITLISEILRFGTINSYNKNIALFSIQNIADTALYMLTAYIGKNVNNCMIYLDSLPTLGMFSTGSTLFYNIIAKSLHPANLMLIENVGSYGTLDFVGLIWIDWGWGAFIIISFLGFFVGLSYKMYIKTNNIYWTIIYSIIYPGIISNIRINYFFLNIFIYPVIAILIIIIISISSKNKIIKGEFIS